MTIFISPHTLYDMYSYTNRVRSPNYQGRTYSKPCPVQEKCGAPMGARRNFCKGRKSPSGVQGRSPGEDLGVKPPEADGILLKITYSQTLSIFSKATLSGNFGMLARCRNSSCGGPIFVGAPVRPNMLNMPKSASAINYIGLQLPVAIYTA